MALLGPGRLVGQWGAPWPFPPTQGEWPRAGSGYQQGQHQPSLSPGGSGDVTQVVLSQLSSEVFLANLAKYCLHLEESLSRCQGNRRCCSSSQTKNV